MSRSTRSHRLMLGVQALAAVVVLGFLIICPTEARADCYYCNCNGTYYDELGACNAACPVSLACFTGICLSSSTCPPPPGPRGPDGSESPPGQGQVCGGDPVVLASGSTFERTLEGAVKGALEPLEFWRTYMSRDAAWEPPAGSAEGEIPRPFGSSPTNPVSLRSWHNFYSMVVLAGASPECVQYVRTPDGQMLDIGQNLCTNTSAGTWSENGPRSRAARERLQWTGSGFLLIQADGGRLVYGARYNAAAGSFYFLTDVYSKDGTRTAHLAYAQPPLAGCPAGAAGSTPGVPYISAVTDTAGATLSFHYKALQSATGETECVIASIAAKDKATGAETSLASYSYAVDGGGIERPGLVAQVAMPDETHVYHYSDTDFVKSVGGTAEIHHRYDSSGRAIASVGENENLTFTAPPLPAGTCLEDSQCCANPVVSRVTDLNALTGDGTETAVESYSETTMVSQAPDVFSYREDRTEGTAPGKRYQYQCGTEQMPAHQTAEQDERGNWTAYTVAAPSSPQAPSVALETSVIARGAIDASGTGALQTEQRSYVYGANGEQLLASSSTASVFGEAGQTARTQYTYSAKNRLTSVIRQGWTQVRDPASGAWTKAQRHLGTFFFDKQCGAAAPDELGRTVEVHGPCWVKSFTDTDCAADLVDAGSEAPVTRLDYWPADQGSNAAGKLRSLTQVVRGGAIGCGTASVQTFFDEYDPLGNATAVRDGNGAATALTYSGNRVTSATLAGLTTRFSYDNGKLVAIQRPAGNYEVLCYRQGTASGACVGGTWSKNLQWRAKAATADGSQWSEKIVYTYWADGTMKDETYWSWNGSKAERRRVMGHSADPQRRPTWQSWGTGSGSFSAASAFDGAGNQTGIGAPFNAAPALCGGVADAASGSPLSTACTALHYDRMNRLDSMTQYPDSDGQRSIFAYDAQGNTSGIKLGCLGSDDYTSCAQPESQYSSDDFGRMVQVSLPSAEGFIRRQFDAQGNVLLKETAAERSAGVHVTYSYDGLGRKTAAFSEFGSASTTLYRQGYDEDGTAPSECSAALDVAASRTIGRLRYRQDSFGFTWFRYSEDGRVVDEVRARDGSCGGDGFNNPSTHYEYSANGLLASVTYPYGRVVNYVYGTGALADRVSRVDVSFFDAGQWQAPVPLLSGILWEPYGGLRGYALYHPASKSASAVEYMLGDDGSQPPAGCTSKVPSAAKSDLTGRLRALRVGTGSFTAGVNSGDIYQRMYTWQADQVGQIDTCLLKATMPRTETYSYDAALRLTGAWGNTDAAGGAFTSRTYGYDGRGRRVSLNEDGVDATLSYEDGALLDRLASQAPSADPLLDETWSYDADGRATRIERGHYAPNAPAHQVSWAFGPSASVAAAEVFRSATVNGATYEYFRDALGRRRAKVYPTGAKDEYFYGRGNELLTDMGVGSTAAVGGPYTADDYVWLDGRPVAMVRGRLDESGNRLSDSTAQCGRIGEDVGCGAYFPVTDHIGKPVLMLDGSRRVTAAPDYEPFGQVNRVRLPAGSAHPYVYDDAPSETVLAWLAQPAENSKVKVDMRALFGIVDTVSTSCRGSTSSFDAYASVRNADTGAELASAVGGARQGQVWTPWFAAPAGWASVVFVNSGAVQVSGSASTPGNGVSLAGYEYRRYQSGARPFLISLRMPGQYYDAETDAADNWHRAYDSSAGRYLQPEPLMQNSKVVEAYSEEAKGLERYSYALNNPIYFGDVNGENPLVLGGAAVAVAIGEALFWTGVIAGGVYCVGTHCLGDLDDLLGIKPQDNSCPMAKGGNQHKIPSWYYQDYAMNKRPGEGECDFIRRRMQEFKSAGNMERWAELKAVEKAKGCRWSSLR
jgi:RHS repeat-associated protein